MRILLTGATGFLGRRVLRGLLDAGHFVRCAVRPGSDLRQLDQVLGPADRSRVRMVTGNLSDPEHCRLLTADRDVVLHLAAALSGSPSCLVANSVVPTRSLAQAAADTGVKRFVLVSSLGVYGPQNLPRGAVLDETTPLDTRPHERDPYTYSKLLQEEVAREIARDRSLPLVVLRPGVIFGDERGLLCDRIGLRLGGWLLRLGGRQTLPLTYVENCAAAVVQAASAAGIDGETFNIVDDDLPTGRDVLRRLKRAGVCPRVLPVPGWAIGGLAWLNERYSDRTQQQLPRVLTRHRVRAVWKPLRYSNDRARRGLGWTPAVDFDSAIRRTLDRNR